jgi:hypothetical protein
MHRDGGSILVLTQAILSGIHKYRGLWKYRMNHLKSDPKYDT